MPKLGVCSRHIGVERAGKLRVKRHGLELHDDKAAQLQTVEQQVDNEVIIANLQADLPANKGKASTQFQQKPLHLVHQCLLEFALAAGVNRAQKVKQIRVFEDLARQIRVGDRQGLSEVRQHHAFPQVQLAL